MPGRLPLYLGISFVSLAMLSYEVALTRIFSIALWYHFAFMVVSIAMLGIAASGTFVSVFPHAKRYERLGRYAIFLSLAVILSYVTANQIPFDPAKISWDKRQVFYIAVYYLVLGMPFFFSGLIILTAMEHMADKAGRIYFFDLIGAAAGSIFILFILTAIGEESSVIIISFLAMSSALLFNINEEKKVFVRCAAPVLAVILIAIFIYKPSIFNINISPYKGMMTALKFPGAEHIKTFRGPSSRVDIIKSPANRYAPGLSFKYMEDLPPQLGIANDGGDLNAVTRWSGDKEKLRFIDYLPSAIPYVIGKNDDVLIIEPKGGLPVLTAIYYSSKNIDKVESNPVIIKAVNETFMDFSGGIYKEKTYTGIGRAFLKTKGFYDIIDVNLTGILPWEGGSYGLTEDFRLTKEAFIDYYQRLKKGGYLSMTLYILPPARMELKILSTMISAMEAIGIKDADKHIAVIRTWNTVTILLKRDELSASDIDSIKGFARDRRFDLVYYSGAAPDETNIYNKLPDNDYFKIVSSIINPQEREKAVKDYVFDISPVTDERPFFYHFLRLKNIFEIYKISGGKWQYFLEEGYLVPIILIQAALIAVLLILLPLFIKKGKHGAPLLQVFIYFSSIGLGFMFLEITIIQRFILYLDHPIYAVTVIIATILLSSGIGSLASQRILIDKEWKGSVIFVLAAIIVLYSVSLKHIISFTLGLEFIQRVALSIVLLIPLGFFMGMPFPMGIRYIAITKGSPLIPWAWGVNGSFSVAGSILAAMLALAVGFRGVMYAASALYLVAFLSIYTVRSLLRKNVQATKLVSERQAKYANKIENKGGQKKGKINPAFLKSFNTSLR